jgi:hypothetical protein
MCKCSLDFNFCEHCVYGKKNRVRFPSGALREEEILQLVHFCVHCWDVFRHMVFVNDFLFPVMKLGFLTNPGHRVRVHISATFASSSSFVLVSSFNQNLCLICLFSFLSVNICTLSNFPPS